VRGQVRLGARGRRLRTARGVVLKAAEDGFLRCAKLGDLRRMESEMKPEEFLNRLKREVIGTQL
jgi:hypothetical protein